MVARNLSPTPETGLARIITHFRETPKDDLLAELRALLPSLSPETRMELFDRVNDTWNKTTCGYLGISYSSPAVQDKHIAFLYHHYLKQLY